MTDEFSFTLSDIPIGYWGHFQKMILQYDIYADHQAKAAVDMWFDIILT